MRVFAFDSIFAGARKRTAFTLLELIVVTIIISLILLIGLPAFNSISLQSQFAKSEQLLNGVTTRAYQVAINDHVLTAVRVAPASWEVDPSGTAGGAAFESSGRQSLVTYKYRASSIPDGSAIDANNDGIPDPVLSERFERLRGGPTAILSTDVWVAPAEAVPDEPTLDTGDDLWLRGTIAYFCADVENSDKNPTANTRPPQTDFLDADDFLLVFNPEGGVMRRRGNMTDPRIGGRRAWPMKSMWIAAANGNPAWQRDSAYEVTGAGVANVDESKPFQRYSAGGVVLYERQRFAAVPASDPQAVQKRLDAIKQTGRVFLLSPTTGSLLGGK